MKLWVKSVSALGGIFATTATIVTTSFAYAKLNKDYNGPEYKSRFEMYTKIDSDASNFKASVIKTGGDIKNDKIASVDLRTKTVNGKDVDQYFEEVAKNNKGVSPDFVIYAGSMTFNNEYTNAVKPSEFIEFIKWFFTNVAWGPEISTLTSFSIVRGVEIDGGSITLGGHEGKLHETTNIKFYPDAFFGSMPLYSIIAGRGNGVDNLLNTFGVPSIESDVKNIVKNIVPLANEVMKEEAGKLFSKQSDADKKKLKNISKLELVNHLYKTGSKVVNGKNEPLYRVFTHNNPFLFKEIIKKYPYHLKETVGPVIKKNSKGEYSIVTEKHKYMPIAERIPLPEMLSLNKNFKGFGTSWLHYVAAHEYGHHQTLQSINDIAEKDNSVMIGGWRKQTGALVDNVVNKNLVNEYLNSRAPGLKVFSVSAKESIKSTRNISNFEKGIYAKFSKDNGQTFETNKEIFGTDSENIFKPELTNNQAYLAWLQELTTYLSNHVILKRYVGRFPIMEIAEYFKDLDKGLQTRLAKKPQKYNFANSPKTRSFTTKANIAKLFNNDTYKGYILNAFDNHSGSLSQGFQGKAQVLQNGHYVNSDAFQQPTTWAQSEKTAFGLRRQTYGVDGWGKTTRGGATYMEQVLSLKQKTKYDVDDFKSIFSDYTMSLPEVLTRDMVQITYRPDASPLMPGMKNLSEANSGFEYFVPKELNSKWTLFRDISGKLTAKIDTRKILTAIFLVNKGEPNNFLGNKVINDNAWNLIVKLKQSGGNLMNLMRSLKIFSKKTFHSDGSIKSMSFFNNNMAYTPSNSTYLGKNLSLANGYFMDRQIRKDLNWSIYDDNGAQTNYSGPTTDLNGKPVTSSADAYWYYLLKSKGIGDRTLSGFWRSKQRDAIYMWGYINNNLASKISYLAIKNKANSTVKYVPIHIGQDNLHYFKNSITGKATTLRDEGFTSWTTDFFSTGEYRNAIINPGIYNISFADSSKQFIGGLTLGSRSVITENGKSIIEAPIKIKNGIDGIDLIALSQFVN